MNQHLQNILTIIQREDALSAEQKRSILHSLKDVDKELEITAFKLDRTEKVKRTTAALLEETITELEQKRKAVEEQKRELEIEASLERVRNHAMAMQSSEELSSLIGTVFTELTKLDLVLTRCVIWVFDETNNAARWWMANVEEPSSAMSFYIKYHEHPAYLTFVNEWKNQNEKFVYDLKGDDKKSWDEILFNETELKNLPEVVKNGMQAPERVLLSASFNNFGGINVASLNPLSEEQFDILLRVAKVFDGTYTRFLDLQKAEAQAREAQIEAAVERVRAMALAMHNSEDLHAVVVTLKKQLLGLNIKGVTAVSMYLEQDDGRIRALDLSSTETSEEEGTAFKMDVVFSLEDTDPDLWIRRIWNGTDDYFIVEADEDDFKRIIQWLYTIDEKEAAVAEKIIREEGIKKAWLPTVRLEKGRLNIDVLEPPGKEIETILLKMGGAFDLAYKRFLDLQKAEAQAREAQIELALERVRARTMAMQKSHELPETSKILFQQIKELGEPVEQCTIGIIREEENVVEISATLYGTTLQKIYLHDINEPYVMNKVFKAWKAQQKTLQIELQGKELNAYNKYRNELTGSEIFPTNLSSENKRIVYCAFFSKGMLALGVAEPRPPESLQLLNRFASVFDLTYTRFLDLQKAEAHAEQARLNLIQIQEAKQKAEAALMELKAMQKQLIQSEKMASLGELTAGIAHEIQNPLNFVNNFAEINLELFEEIKNEKSKAGNDGEEAELLNDIEENLKKIAHHGKRADAIVKSMLQHSRKTGGDKEPTDINALVDEYLRLSYHGLRAKDKSFNCILETHFDASAGKWNVIGQDIGRVLLNLFNNAFYAVAEKKKQQPKGYEPTVTVSTRKHDDFFEIKVSDNGTGIPEKVLEKVYQPFFTTKPTGEGTGLGLSLSYDIITKGHGGEMKVNTKEGEGSAFIIQLPNSVKA